MPTNREIALLIPKKYRDEILELNMINRASPIVHDPVMNYLAVAWKDNVDNTASTSCNVCMTGILQHWQSLQETLLTLRKEELLLDTLKHV